MSEDEPLRRREFVDALAAALDVPPPRLPPAWLARVGGGLAELLARSVRTSNRKLGGGSSWAPRYPSVREGWWATLAELD